MIELDLWIYSGEELEGYPHGHGIQIYANQSTFTGTWHKGLKVGTGIHEVEGTTIKAKFRSGINYKFLEVKSNTLRYDQIGFKQPRYSKHGEFYQELPEHSLVTLHIFKSTPLFGGRPSKNDYIIKKKGKNYSLFIDQEKTFRICELQAAHYRFIGNVIQLLPVGKGKFFLNDNFTLKGVTRAGYLNGQCKITKNDLSILFDAEDFLKSESFTVIFKKSTVSEKVRIREGVLVLEKISQVKKNSEIFELIIKACERLKCFIIELSLRVKENYAIFASVNLQSNWGLFEKNMQKTKAFYKKFQEEYREKSEKSEESEENEEFEDSFLENSEKSEESEENEEFEDSYSEISNEERNFIKQNFLFDERVGNNCIQLMRYDNCREWYVGEIRYGVRHGLGILKFSNGGVFKGYFENGKIHGKGRYQCGDYNFEGYWKNNHLYKVYRLVIETRFN